MRYCTPEGIRIQVRQIQRWLTAARQDSDPGVRFLHASYGVGNLDILRQVVSDEEIRAAAGVEAVGLLQELSRVQDAAQRAYQRQKGGSV